MNPRRAIESMKSMKPMASDRKEFPILCQTCLGNNPYMRMIKEKFGSECNICQRPYTVFRWMPGKGMRYKKTEVCQTCAKIKNVCQTCLLDLEYGLPVQVRDYALQLQDDVPKHGANRDFYVQNIERELAQTDGTKPAGALANIPEQGPNEMLKKLARTQPYYDRNRPHICSFWVKGECKRGEECPFRHEKPTDPDDPLSVQNMKDRYYGSKDPVADKLLNRAKAMPVLRPPEDSNITTLYVGGLGEAAVITENDLQNYFYQFGEIRNISMLPHKGCAFIQFTTRAGAEMAAERAFNKLTIKQRKLAIRWGKPQSQQTAAIGSVEKPLHPVPGLPHSLPVPDFFGLEDTSGEKSWDNKKRRVEGSGLAPPNASIPPEQGSLVVPQLTPKMPPPFTADRVSGVFDEGSQLMRVAPPETLLGKRVTHQAQGPAAIYYPSQDPQRLGAKGDVIE